MNQLYESGGQSAGVSARDIALPRLRDLREREEQKKRKSEKKQPRWDSLYPNLRSDIPSHQFRHVLLLRSESLGQSYTLGKGTSQACENQEERITGDRVRSCLPRAPFPLDTISCHFHLCSSLPHPSPNTL